MPSDSMNETSSFLGKWLGAVEGHVLDEMGQALLVIVFQNRAGLDHQPQLRALFRFLVIARM